jgi:hypothetical protein
MKYESMSVPIMIKTAKSVVQRPEPIAAAMPVVRAVLFCNFILQKKDCARLPKSYRILNIVLNGVQDILSLLICQVPNGGWSEKNRIEKKRP